MRPRLSILIPRKRFNLHNDVTNAQSHLTKLSRSADGQRRVLPQLGILQDDLMNWLMASDIGLTFRQCFPREWQRSSESTHIEHGMCARENELFEHASRCFPTTSLTNYWWGGHDRPQGFLIRIAQAMLTPPDEWDESEWGQLVLEHLCDDGSSGLVSGRAAYLQPYLDIPLPRYNSETFFDVVCFQQRCRAKRNRHWNDLAKAMQVIAGVGNPFLEPSPNEEPVGRFMRELGMSIQAIHHLERQWQGAQACYHALSRTQAWLGAKPERWRNVFALWSSCLTPA